MASMRLPGLLLLAGLLAGGENVPAASGDCSIEIVGDAGASFFLAQH